MFSVLKLLTGLKIVAMTVRPQGELSYVTILWSAWRAGVRDWLDSRAILLD